MIKVVCTYIGQAAGVDRKIIRRLGFASAATAPRHMRARSEGSLAPSAVSAPFAYSPCRVEVLADMHIGASCMLLGGREGARDDGRARKIRAVSSLLNARIHTLRVGQLRSACPYPPKLSVAVCGKQR